MRKVVHSTHSRPKRSAAQTGAVEDLADFETPRGIEFLGRALEDRTASVRRSAISALGQSTDPRAIEDLRRFLETRPEYGDAEAVIEAFESRDTPERRENLKMPGLDGLATLQRLQASGSKARVIVLTASDDKGEFVQAMKLGVSGIVLKQTATELLIKSIRKVHAGEIWLDSHTTAAVIRQFVGNDSVPPPTPHATPRAERSLLSQREREIVGLVAQGFKNKEIAEKMFISEQTLKNHLYNSFDKLGVSDRLELALCAIHDNLVSVVNCDNSTVVETTAAARRTSEESKKNSSPSDVTSSDSAPQDVRERRTERRFGIQLAARYKMLYGQPIGETGAGRTLDFSSSGVWFSTQTRLTAGMPLELSIAWPVLFNDSVPLRLLVYGCVTRSNEHGAAAGIERYEFRTVAPGSRGLPPGES